MTTDEPSPTVTSTDAQFSAVYDRLKAMAATQLARGGATPTLNTTALVHDLYLRMQQQPELAFGHSARFFAYAAQAMRHLLADRARDRLRIKAGGDWQRVTLGDERNLHALDSAEQALRLDSAITRLAETDARAAQVVELRYFAGLSLEQVASALGVTRRTIDRDWRYARAFLRAELD